MNRRGFKGTFRSIVQAFFMNTAPRTLHEYLETALWRQSRSLFIRTMTVGPGITPGLLTLPTHTAEAVRVTKRSRAMRIARNYRRWGVTPRPENVATSISGGGEFLTYISEWRIAAF
jgi:hypothetical protein